MTLNTLEQKTDVARIRARKAFFKCLKLESETTDQNIIKQERMKALKVTQDYIDLLAQLRKEYPGSILL